MKSVALSILALLLLGVGVFFLSIVGLQQFDAYQHRLMSPTGLNEALVAIATTSAQLKHDKKIVYGFLPYWTIKTAQIPQQLTNVGYFSISVDKDGNFVTRQDGYAEPGWRTYNSAELERVRTVTSEQHQKLEILITMMTADDIASFLTNKSAQVTFQTNLRQFIHSQPLDGVNMDVEYAGDVTDQLRAALTQVIADTSQTVHSVDPNAEVSIDIFADSATRQRLYDVSALAPHVDHIIVMTYDFFRASSPQSGPVAPVFGSDKNRWDSDIATNLKVLIQQAPPEKILLGIPFYGYEWRTSGDAPGSSTYPKTGELATYKRVHELLVGQKAQEQWDADALSPFLTYNDNGKTQMIFYENSRSLSYKLDLVNNTDLGGIAIWALGYEGSTRELWDVIGQKL
ncbi:MAG TPA: glycosyl hydrolase family 18 protein [Candidatus Saccharimonadia bacterium]|nr:glycosyl hydrolase family 18 protein [Candidatus Saccharimonadia bacterium]